MKAIIVGFFVIALSAPASAQDGDFVRAMCLSSDSEQVALCAGYTTGLAQALMLSNRVQSPLGNFCESEQFEPSEAGAIMLEWLDVNPDKATQDSAATMLMALQDKFPC